jgi:hypothetical protein
MKWASLPFRKKIEKWVSLVVSRPGLVSHPTGWTLCGGCEQQSTGVISTNRVVVVVCCLVDAIVGWKTNKRMKKKKMKSHLEEDPKECLRDLSGLAESTNRDASCSSSPPAPLQLVVVVTNNTATREQHKKAHACCLDPMLAFRHAATWLQSTQIKPHVSSQEHN